LQIDAQRYLDLIEKAGKLYVWDTESQGREGDYGRMYVVSVKPFGKDPISFVIGENMQDKGMVKEARDFLADADAWVTFYGKGHDVPLLNTRLVRWGYDPLPAGKIPHIDMFYQLVAKLKTGRKSQAHLLEFLQDTMIAMGIEPEKKMTVSPNVWSDLATHYTKNIRILKERCESDCSGLEALMRVTRNLIRDITR
jgi:hypothetical protein